LHLKSRIDSFIFSCEVRNYKETLRRCPRFTFDSPSARLRASCKKNALARRGTVLFILASLLPLQASKQLSVGTLPPHVVGLFSHAVECIARVWLLKRCANLFLLKLAESLPLVRISVPSQLHLHPPIFSCPSYLSTSCLRLETCTLTEIKADHTITLKSYVILLYFDPPMLSHSNLFHTIPYLAMADT
jgi:hypothetical protein